MSNKFKIALMIFLGLILAAVGVFASILMIQRFQAEQSPSVIDVDLVRTSVVVMTRDLSLGSRIAEADIALATVPVDLVPRTAITELNEAVGKIIKADLLQGQMVLANNLANPTNNNRDLSFILSDEHVLMAFPAEDLMSRESMIQRGDIVDIFATFSQEILIEDTTSTEEEAELEQISRTFTLNSLQRVGITALILNVIEGTDSNQGDTGLAAGRQGMVRAYLLALDPQEALILKHLKDTGAIFDIVLRVPTSTVEFELTPVTEQFIIEFYGLEIFP